MRIQTGRYDGFTIVELMTVVAIIGLMLAIAIPSFVRTRDTSQLTAVYNNLRIIESAKDQWALQNKKGTGDTTDLSALSDYLRGGTIKPVVHETYESSVIGSPAFATTNVKLGTYAPSAPISIP